MTFLKCFNPNARHCSSKTISFLKSKKVLKKNGICCSRMKKTIVFSANYTIDADTVKALSKLTSQFKFKTIRLESDILKTKTVRLLPFQDFATALQKISIANFSTEILLNTLLFTPEEIKIVATLFPNRIFSYEGNRYTISSTGRFEEYTEEILNSLAYSSTSADSIVRNLRTSQEPMVERPFQNVATALQKISIGNFSTEIPLNTLFFTPEEMKIVATLFPNRIFSYEGNRYTISSSTGRFEKYTESSTESFEEYTVRNLRVSQKPMVERPCTIDSTSTQYYSAVSVLSQENYGSTSTSELSHTFTFSTDSSEVTTPQNNNL